MKLIAPNGLRITRSLDTMTVAHRISDVSSDGGGSFVYDVDDYEDFTDSIEPVKDHKGDDIFLDEEGNEWPRRKIQIVK